MCAAHATVRGLIGGSEPGEREAVVLDTAGRAVREWDSPDALKLVRKTFRLAERAPRSAH